MREDRALRARSCRRCTAAGRRRRRRGGAAPGRARARRTRSCQSGTPAGSGVRSASRCARPGRRADAGRGGCRAAGRARCRARRRGAARARGCGPRARPGPSWSTRPRRSRRSRRAGGRARRPCTSGCARPRRRPAARPRRTRRRATSRWAARARHGRRAGRRGRRVLAARSTCATSCAYVVVAPKKSTATRSGQPALGRAESGRDRLVRHHDVRRDAGCVAVGPRPRRQSVHYATVTYGCVGCVRQGAEPGRASWRETSAREDAVERRAPRVPSAPCRTGTGTGSSRRGASTAATAVP